jgi:hypothetical protein
VKFSSLLFLTFLAGFRGSLSPSKGISLAHANKNPAGHRGIGAARVPQCTLPLAPAVGQIKDTRVGLGTFSLSGQFRARQHTKWFVSTPAVDCEILIQG